MSSHLWGAGYRSIRVWTRPAENESLKKSRRNNKNKNNNSGVGRRVQTVSEKLRSIIRTKELMFLVRCHALSISRGDMETETHTMSETEDVVWKAQERRRKGKGANHCNNSGY